MLHFKTLYLNVSEEIVSSGIRAELDDSRILRFCNHTFHTYATIFLKLSEVFLNIEVGVQNGYIKKPSKISILLPKYVTRKFKSTDEETSLERILWFLNNFKPTTNGLIISLYINDKISPLDSLDSHFNFTNLNPFKELWVGGGNYVTIQLPESSDKPHFNKNIDFIIKYLNSKNIPIEYISYETSLEKAYRLLLKSKIHIGYVGSLYFIAAGAKVPTLGLAEFSNYHGILEYYNKNGKSLPYVNKFSRNRWGNSSMPRDRVLQFNESGRIVNDIMAGSIDICKSIHTAKRLLKNVIEKNDYREFDYKMIRVKSHENFIKGKNPWSYLYIDDYLPPEEFLDLRSKALKINPDNNKVSREIFDYDPTPQMELLFPLLKNDSDFYIRSYSNLKKFIHFAVTPENFIHKMHTEAPFKIMSAVLYLGPDENRGTRLYKTPDGEPFEIEWKPNRLFVFCGYDHTFHDYLSTSVRYTYNYFLVDKPTVENPEYKENLLDLEYIKE